MKQRWEMMIGRIILLVGSMNESTAGVVGTGTCASKVATEFCLIPRMAPDRTQLMFSMGKLALGAILAVTSIL